MREINKPISEQAFNLVLRLALLTQIYSVISAHSIRDGECSVKAIFDGF